MTPGAGGLPLSRCIIPRSLAWSRDHDVWLCAARRSQRLPPNRTAGDQSSRSRGLRARTWPVMLATTCLARLAAPRLNWGRGSTTSTGPVGGRMWLSRSRVVMLWRWSSWIAPTRRGPGEPAVVWWAYTGGRSSGRLALACRGWPIRPPPMPARPCSIRPPRAGRRMGRGLAVVRPPRPPSRSRGCRSATVGWRCRPCPSTGGCRSRCGRTSGSEALEPRV